eukprot:4357036-Pyramimonas_sp.AAC.1
MQRVDVRGARAETHGSRVGRGARGPVAACPRRRSPSSCAAPARASRRPCWRSRPWVSRRSSQSALGR